MRYKLFADNEIMKLGPYFRKEEERTDWDGMGVFSAAGANLYFTMLYYPGRQLTFTGFEMNVKRVSSVP